jgi:formylglycine-generating enzyme required for sulfatase activity
MSTGIEPIRVFYSYAREDQELRETLEKHLRPLKRRRIITDWHDRLITAGAEWAKEIDEHLESADLILLLISPDFMASDYCHDVELKRAMEKHEAREARIIPVILRPARWQGFAFSKLQCLPTDARPVTRWPDRDEAFVDIVAGIEKAAVELWEKRKTETARPAAPPPEISQPKPVRPAPPAIENIHGWAANKVQALQQQMAQALGMPVVFQDTLKDGTSGPEMVVIPGGRFLMGSPPDELERGSDERQHEAEVKRFAIGKYAVTFEEYDHFAKTTDREKPGDQGWGRGQRPVINVSWQDAVAYAEWLSQQTGQAYRLPTEAEWEYAARAGTTTPFYFGSTISTDQANYDGNYTYGDGRKGVYRKKTVEVGQFPANAWGLYDMHGNVWEWTCSEYDEGYGGAELRCLDNDAGGLRVLRGGSWLHLPRGLRAAYRPGLDPVYRSDSSGFRPARNL